jgi:hypothetical protein
MKLLIRGKNGGVGGKWIRDEPIYYIERDGD